MYKVITMSGNLQYSGTFKTKEEIDSLMEETAKGFQCAEQFLNKPDGTQLYGTWEDNGIYYNLGKYVFKAVEVK